MLQAPPLAALLRFGERALHRGRKAHEVGLQHVIGGAVPQRPDRVLLAQGPRHEHERRIGRQVARQGERRHAVEAWHRKVRKDDVGGELAQRADEPLLRVRDAVRDAQPGAFQLAQLQLCVGRIVLGEQQPEHRDVRLRAGHQG